MNQHQYFCCWAWITIFSIVFPMPAQRFSLNEINYCIIFIIIKRRIHHWTKIFFRRLNLPWETCVFHAFHNNNNTLNTDVNVVWMMMNDERMKWRSKEKKKRSTRNFKLTKSSTRRKLKLILKKMSKEKILNKLIDDVDLRTQAFISHVTNLCGIFFFCYTSRA